MQTTFPVFIPALSDYRICFALPIIGHGRFRVTGKLGPRSVCVSQVIFRYTHGFMLWLRSLGEGREEGKEQEVIGSRDAIGVV